MTDTFEDLKIAPELVAGAEALGWDAPSGLQQDAMPVIRRGNNVVLHASAGSGATGAWGLGVLDRLAGSEEEPGDPWALVLVPDATTASAVASALAQLAAPAGLRVRALGSGWAAGPTHLLVASVDAAIQAVRGSRLKLERVAAVVVDGADTLDDADWSHLETLVDAVPGSAQRVLVTGRFDDAIDRFIEGHVRKAMTVPPRKEPTEPPEDAPRVKYAVVPDAEKTDVVVRLVADMAADQVAVVCRTRDRGEEVALELTGRGVLGDDDGAPRVLVLPRTEADHRSVQAAVLSFDVPLDAAEMEALHGNGGAVLVTPRERPHLVRIAARAGVQLQPVPEAPAPATAVDHLRNRIRAAARSDLAPELALLEPLLAELPAAEVAAAAIRLAREALPRPQAETRTPAAPASQPPSSGAAPPPDAGTWVHLFLSIGHRDEVGPGDIVGAITGEADVSGDKVGKIDIRESHTTVEVATDVAAKVIEALNGRSLKGRSLRVDYDRKDRGGRTSGGRDSGGSRGGPRGGSRGGSQGERRPGRRPRS